MSKLDWFNSPTVKFKIAKRIILVFLLLAISFPFALFWAIFFTKRAPWVDPLMDWAIDGPITEYERKNA